MLRLARPRIRSVASGTCPPDRQTRHRAVPRPAPADRNDREKIRDRLSRLQGGLHPLAASLRRVTLAPDGARKDAPPARAGVDCEAPGDSRGMRFSAEDLHSLTLVAREAEINSPGSRPAGP